MSCHTFSRRSFLALSAILPGALRSPASASIPMGLELYSVREVLKQNPEGTVRAVAQMGYQGVEFYAPYFEWTEAQAKQMRKLLDDLGIRCFSTHNDSAFLDKDKINRAGDINLILGSKYVVLASAKPAAGPNNWMAVADLLNFAAGQLELRCGKARVLARAASLRVRGLGPARTVTLLEGDAELAAAGAPARPLTRLEEAAVPSAVP